MHRKMFTVGPVEVADEILEVMKTPMIGHRTQECYDLYANIKKKLQRLLNTKEHCFIFASSSSGVAEAAIRNCVKKMCLNVTNGAFSGRWNTMLQANGKPVKNIEFELGEPIDPVVVDEELSTGEYDSFMMVHNETSTGVLSDLAAISKVVMKYPDVVFMVDAVTSMSATQLLVDEWGIDICFAGVQKAFALPPGMAVASISQKALDRAKEVEDRGWYFDLLVHLKYYVKDQYPTTPPISLMYALDKQLDRIFAEGVEDRFRRHENMRDAVHAWAKGRGFKLFAKSGFESPTLTCIDHGGKVNFTDLKQKIAAKGYEISKGYGSLKDTTFRIGHMGDIDAVDVKELLDIMDDVL